jgi:hypothetical protein
MNAEKASTLKLLREGIGNPVHLIESRGGGAVHEVRAHLPGHTGGNVIPVLFLISSLAFLEAGATPRVTDEVKLEGDDELDEDLPSEREPDNERDYAEIDGWTPADFLSHLRYAGPDLSLELGEVRGRSVFTDIRLSQDGHLHIKTLGRGQSANRWLSYVQGRIHLREV